MGNKLEKRGFEQFIAFVVGALTVAGTSDALKQRGDLVAAQRDVDGRINFLASITHALSEAKKLLAAETKEFKRLLNLAEPVGRDVFGITVQSPTYSTIDQLEPSVRCEELVTWLENGGEKTKDFREKLAQQRSRFESATDQVKTTKVKMKSAKRDLGLARSDMFGKARQAEIYLEHHSAEGHAALLESRRAAVQRKRGAKALALRNEQEAALEAQAKAECEALRAKAANADQEDKQVLPPPTPLARPA